MPALSRGHTGEAIGKKVLTHQSERSRTEEDSRERILTLARENEWGFKRVRGELKKVGITTVSRTTVANILRAAGFAPGTGVR